MRNILLIVLIIGTIFARENPFEPAVKEANAKAPVKISKPKAAEPKNSKKEISLFKWLKIEIGKNYIYIKTKDRLFKKFNIENPDKIVLDFRAKKSFSTKKVKIESGYIDKIAVGSHKSYYRIALRLAKKSRYELKKEENGYKLIFRDR